CSIDWATVALGLVGLVGAALGQVEEHRRLHLERVDAFLDQVVDQGRIGIVKRKIKSPLRRVERVCSRICPSQRVDAGAGKALFKLESTAVPAGQAAGGQQQVWMFYKARLQNLENSRNFLSPKCLGKRP